MGIESELDKLVGLFAELPQVEAIALGGSSASGRSDAMSDFDLCVLPNEPLPLETRWDIVRQLGVIGDPGHDYNGGGDEWTDAATGTHFDLMYFGLEFFREQIERPLRHFQPSLGYTTAFAYTVSQGRILYDPDGKFAALQALARKPYPDALRENVVRYNRPMLRGFISSYYGQLEKAVVRNDLVSLNHRLAALLASYFDIIFAVNRALHPGEKRLLATALTTCPSLPENFEQDVSEMLRSVGDGGRLLTHVTRLLDALDVWLVEGFDDLASTVRLSGYAG